MEMEKRLRELEEIVNVLAGKLREQYVINSRLIEKIQEIGNSEYHDFAMNMEALDNSINRLEEMNERFGIPVQF